MIQLELRAGQSIFWVKETMNLRTKYDILRYLEANLSGPAHI